MLSKLKIFSLFLILCAVCGLFERATNAAVFERQNSAVKRQIKQTRAVVKRRAQRAKPKRTQPASVGVGFVTTPPETVAEMLRLANLKKTDILYDLGSGDGRIVIAAAKNYGVRAVGVEYDAKLIEESRKRAADAGVSHLTTFVRGDFYQVDLRRASVVTLYLSDKINLRLRPKLLGELPAGARIVSHDFRMGDWQPEKSVRVPWENLYRTVYLWTIPKNRRVPKTKTMPQNQSAP